jgi:hypothetical protein
MSVRLQSFSRSLLPLVIATLGVLGCDTPDSSHEPGSASPTPTPSFTPIQGNSVFYKLADRRLYRIEAKAGSIPESISDRLKVTTEGGSISPDGGWLVFAVTTPQCESCLAVSSAPFLTYEIIKVAGQAIQYVESMAIGPNGDVVLYSASGPHLRDIYSVRRGTTWASSSGATLLTGASTYARHEMGSVSYDGSKAIFGCTPGDDFQSEGSAICEASVDGGNFRVVLAPGIGAGKGFTAFHHPGWFPDGSTVLEGLTPVEKIYRYASGAAAPVLISRQGNDNSPCALPDGRVASLQETTIHRLQIAEPEGGASFMLTPDGIDVADVGISCGGMAAVQQASKSPTLHGVGAKSATRVPAQGKAKPFRK